jgi:aspartyl/asparaginyl beta-hydroxylase (cupin superfamily)/Tfp pilus assembly protein PilF
MNARFPEAAPDSDEQKVTALMAHVERLVSERRDADAQRLLGQAAAILPDHPLVLHERARRLLADGDPAAAQVILERVVGIAPSHVPFWLSLAAVLRTLQRREQELAVLERALALDPTHLVVLLQKAALFDLMNRPRAAAAVYVNALQTLAPGIRLPAPIEAHVEHARKRVSENAAALAALLDSRLAALKLTDASGSGRMRFDRCMDRMLGRRQIYVPEPTYMLFPYLQSYEFFARDYFPWLENVEAATDSIRDELLGVLKSDREGLRPYIAFEEGLPLNQWRELNHSRRWGAYFLWNQGQPQREHMARCPRTVAALAAAPQVDIADRGPTAFFSILEPHTKIPAHTGVTNTRLTVHLPLIVPSGCRFRVGGETREWREGTAWVFDDTIEHEAWNDSDEPRAILIFDVWNPQLTPVERDLVREATIVMAEYNAEGAIAGMEQ